MELSIRKFFRLLSLHKKFIAIFLVVFSGLTMLYSYIMPHEFEATASLLPPEDSNSGGGLSGFLSQISGGISLGGLGQSNKSAMFEDILASRSLGEYIAENTGVKKYPAFQVDNEADLHNMLVELFDVKLNRSGVIYLSAAIPTTWFPGAEDDEKAAKMVAEITNAAIDGLDYLNRKKTMSKARKKRIFISKMLDENRRQLDSIDNMLKEFQEENKVLAIEEQTTAIMTNTVNIGAELIKAEAELGIISIDYGPGSAMYKAGNRKVEELRHQYNQAQQGGLTPTDRFSIPLEKVPALIKKYRNLKRGQKIMEQVILYLETQKYQEAIQEQSDIPTVQALDNAIAPQRRSSPSRKLMLMLSLVFGGLLSVGIVVGRAFYHGEMELRKED